MNITEAFKLQLDSGAKEMFFFGIEDLASMKIEIKSHKGSLDSFPKLTFVRMLTDSVPLFKVKND